MTIDVSILDVELAGDQIDVTVTVSTGENDTIDYQLEVTHTDTGDSAIVDDQLFGGSGSFPGDSNTHTVTLDSGGRLAGTVTADVGTTSGPADSDTDTVDWAIDPTTVIDVEILSAQIESDELVVQATVSTSEPIYYEYDLEISDGRGNTVTVPPVGSAELFGTSGSFPGDSNVHEGRFAVAPGDSGTASAEIVDEPTLTASASWEFEDDDVTEPDPFDPQLITTTCAGLPSEVVEGQPFELDYSLDNANEQDAVVEYAITAGDTAIDGGTVTVAAGSTRTISTSPTIDSSGDYTVAVVVDSAQPA